MSNTNPVLSSAFRVPSRWMVQEGKLKQRSKGCRVNSGTGSRVPGPGSGEIREGKLQALTKEKGLPMLVRSLESRVPGPGSGKVREGKLKTLTKK